MRQPRQRFIDTGDTRIAVNHWRGSGDPVLLLHATGFHSRCWDQVVHLLPERDIYAADLRFHGASGDNGKVSWAAMCADILHVVETLDLQRTVGAGHSIGGHILARVAVRVPQHFARLLLIDPVIQCPERYARMRRFAAQHSAADHPVSRRRNQWRGPQEMYERFLSRPPFNTWRPEVLRDYCDHALGPADAQGNHPLACDPLHEASIYMHQENNAVIYEELPDLQLPVTLLRAPPGTGSTPDFRNSPTWPQLAGVLPDCHEVYLPDNNHFIPMQDPALVAKYILAGQ
ncbi:MAG: alpha/beta hydrolase [Halioglobus sp.]|nr:alpha/beta hydrolase [Halioglobus sp.]